MTLESARYGTGIDASTRQDTWQLRVYVGIDPTTRRQRWLAKTVHGSTRFASKQLRDLVEEAGRGRLRAGTVLDLLEHWFEVASPGWAVSTASHTRSIIDAYLKPYFGHLSVGKITTEDIDDFYGYLLSWGGERHQPLAPGTVARVHGVLHRAFAQAVRWGWVSVNPVSDASPPRVQPAEIRPPSPQQVVAILEWTREKKPALFCYLRLAACTGARRGQLLALRWRDVDWERSAIAFTRGLAVGPKGLELRSTKNHRTYRAELDPETLAALVEHRAVAEAQARKAGVELAAEAFVFSRRVDGATPWLPNWTTKEFVRARRRAGLAHFRLHNLRHFMATQMLAAGVPIVAVSQRLSHARVSTTLNVYAHSVPGGDRRAAETLAAILADGRPESGGATDKENTMKYCRYLARQQDRSQDGHR
jgi:integrase